MIVFILLTLCMTAFAQTARINLLKPPKTKTRSSKKVNRSKKSVYQRILEGNRKIEELLRRKTSRPIIWEGSRTILTGKTYRGVLMNSIVSTNLSSPVVVMARSGQGLPYKTKFACKGVTRNKRVLTICDKMITKRAEIIISAQILNMDGSAGLVGEYNDGKEDLIAGAVISDFSQGVLAAAQDRVVTPIGSMTDSHLKNQVFGGLINSGKTTSQILLDEMKNVEPVVTVNGGEEVLIYFLEAVHEF